MSESTGGGGLAAELLFTARDLARTRFAVSPMWEVGPSLRLLRSGLAHPVHRPWAEQVRPRLAALGPAYALPAELVPPAGCVPDFINPTPAGPAPTPAEEPAAIRATPAERVRRDLDRLRDDRGRPGPGCARSTATRRADWAGSPRRSRRTGSSRSPRTGRGSAPCWTRTCCTAPDRPPSAARRGS
ncbi:hypothetical protein [Kitasatospora sp. NPDC086791]|uniref:hypothetical protein n=1 Tax=Kitasatospora sp. NPDC086791 TaxID=3155178 RepID=UPI0034291F91